MQDDALVKVYSKLYSNPDRMPQGIRSHWSRRARSTMCRFSRSRYGERAITAINFGRWPTKSSTPFATGSGCFGNAGHRWSAANDARDSDHQAGRLWGLAARLSRICGRPTRALQAGEFAEGNQEFRVEAGNLSASAKT